MPTPSAPTVQQPAAASGSRAARRRPVWAFPLVVIAVLAVAAGLVVGIVGLTANPVRSVNGDGTSTLHGSFQPYECNAAHCDGYIQAGARSVFVQFPSGCPPPVRGSDLTVTARPAPDLGKASYRAVACA
jgi:hypothetical protein